MRPAFAALALLLVVGCRSAQRVTPMTRPLTPGEEVAGAACGFVGSKSITVAGARYRFDCSGFVEASLASAGFTFAGSTKDLFATARQLGVLHRRHRPDVGDVAFFDDTWDKNGDHRFNDPLTHVALVVRVDPDGTIGMIHLGGSGIVPLTMNLHDPDARVDASGKVINDYLRAPTSRDTARTKRFAAELWAGFGSFWKVPPSPVPKAESVASSP